MKKSEGESDLRVQFLSGLFVPISWRVARVWRWACACRDGAASGPPRGLFLALSGVLSHFSAGGPFWGAGAARDGSAARWEVARGAGRPARRSTMRGTLNSYRLLGVLNCWGNKAQRTCVRGSPPASQAKRDLRMLGWTRISN